MDSVAAGFGTDDHKRVAFATGDGRDDAVGFDHTDRHGVDQGVAGVGLIEEDLPGHRGHPEAIAVVTDTAHDTVHEIAYPRIIRRAETKRIERGDRAGAHSENVSQYPADAGGRSLVGFNRGRVVMRLNLEHHRQAVTDIHRPGVLLARFGQKVFSLPRERLEKGNGVLVRAVLGPHHRENAQFRVGHLTAEDILDAGVFFFAQSMSRHHLGSYGRLCVLRRHLVSFSVRWEYKAVARRGQSRTQRSHALPTQAARPLPCLPQYG